MGFAIITGHLGVVGSSVAKILKEHTELKIAGIDCDLRSQLFDEVEPLDKTKWKVKEKEIGIDLSFNIDIRDGKEVDNIFKEISVKDDIDLIIHCAAQPSHDWAKSNVIMDFDINARATIIICEAVKKYASNSLLIFLSTNKVYGNNPNKLPFIEFEERYELPQNHKYFLGIDESMSIDNCLHSYFGVSKVSADLYVQEYAKNAGLKTIVLRGGCLTGGRHRGAKLHGFLSYLIKTAIEGDIYEIIGYKGKQVRDNLHADDIGKLIISIYKSINQINSNENNVFNLGGGRENSVSILEIVRILKQDFSINLNYNVTETPRTGDHQWYITSYAKIKDKFNWMPSISVHEIIEDILNY